MNLTRILRFRDLRPVAMVTSGSSAFIRSFYSQGQNPEPNVREYFYYIDHQGMLFLDDAKIKNFTCCYKEQMFLKNFFKRLKKNDTGRFTNEFPYLSLCGKERNFVRCEDLPIVFTHLIEDKPALLSYNHGSRFLAIDFEPKKITMVPMTGRVYHPGPIKTGGIGLLSDKLAIAWTSEKRFVFEDGEEAPPTKFWWNGELLSLDNELLEKIPTDKFASPQYEAAHEEGITNHSFATKEFFMITSDGTKAYIKYEVLSDCIHFLTTQVPSSQQGKGLGGVLVKTALDFCVKEQMRFKSSCWYIDAYLAKNPSKSYRRLFVKQ